jgi:hypothetical protein
VIRVHIIRKIKGKHFFISQGFSTFASTKNNKNKTTKMKHITLFENFYLMHFFSEEGGTQAENLASRKYWKEFDEVNGETATQWRNDPGYQMLSTELGSPIESIKAYNSEEDEITYEISDEIENLTPSNSIKSNQEYIGVWEYFPEHGVAVAYGNGGAPDYYFVVVK